MIIDCKEIRQKEMELLKAEHELNNCKVAFYQIGEDYASNVYVRNKIKLCEELNIKVVHEIFDKNISEEDFLKIIEKSNNDNDINGIMVQLPLPAHINEEKVINAILPEKDIDGFNHINKGKLMSGDKSGIVACTPLAVMDILRNVNVDLKGKNVVIVGRSNIVGKPLAQLMINAGATVTVCNSSTNKHYLGALISQSDVFVSAIGCANYFDENFFDEVGIPTSRLKNIVGIDVGINRSEDNKLCGDISKTIYDNFKHITPVPGGVGVMTVLNVIKNIIKCYNK